MLIKNKPQLFLLLIIVFFIPIGCVQGQLGKDNGGEYHNGMVVCAYPDAAQVGLSILKKGGNAVDAAVAVQFALAVTFPDAGNIGGGGFMVFRAAKGETNTLDFREKAPALATTNMYLDASGNVIPGLSLSSHKASGVPGSIDGMVEAHKKYGKLKWADLVQPAIDLAKNGFKATARTAADFNRQKAGFMRMNPGKNYLIKDEPWKEGDLVIQEDLAKTL